MSGPDYKTVTSFRNETTDFSKLPPLKFYLSENAQLTDLISQSFTSARGLLISTALFKAMHDFLPADIQYTPATVISKDKEIDYFWLHPTIDYDQLIDFGKTRFQIQHVITDEITEFTVKSLDQFIQRRFRLSGLMRIQAQHNVIKFNPDVSPQRIFLLTLNKSSIYISDKLAAAIREKDFTGLEIKEITHNFH